MTKGVIYCYLNPINNKRYIGQTINEKLRKREFETKPLYCTRLSKGGLLTKFDKARQEYGIDTFIYSILHTVEHEDKQIVKNMLNELEIYYINKYDSYHNGYNSTSGGQSYTLSEETKQRISNSLKGRKMSELTYQKLCLTGYKHSDKSKELISILAQERYRDKTKHPMYGKHHSEESKLKNSNSRKGKRIGIDHPSSKTVLCFTKTGKFVKEFVCSREALEWLGKYSRNNSQICSCCNGKIKTAYGYVWKYKNYNEKNS